MWRLLLVSALAAVVTGGAPSNFRRSGGRIVGGYDADIVDFPFQLSLQESGWHICGASIISPNVAVTAAHCVGSSAINYSVRAGSSLEGSGGQIVNVAKVIQNPKDDSDCAILFLEKSLVFGPGVQAIAMVSEDEETPAGTIATVSGWGSRSPWRFSSPYQLQAADVLIVSREKCNELYGGGITETMICAGLPEGGKDSCQGDSGGPLVAGGKLVGIVSWGAGCARPNTPGVYVDVASQRSFIRDTTGI